ncbi:g5949 [Coccomyxa elongata]
MDDFAAFEDFPAVADGLPETVPNTQYYVDEEEALGFHIWVAELELLVGQARGSKQGVDPVAAMELLQKLQVTIESSDKARIREYQRRCEDALEDNLLKGTAPPVRRLICACLVRLYSVGDSLPLYSRVASLQTFLGSKEALNRSLPVPARLGALQALAALACGHGRSLASVAPESLALGAKHAARQSEAPVRIAALQLMAAVVGGLGGGDRNSASVQAEALKAVSRVAKDGANSEARLALAGVVRAVAQAGGAALWAANGRPYEDAAALCVGFLDDPMRAAGDAAGAALGDFVAAAASDAAAEAIKALEKKPAKRAALEKLQAEAFTACLVDPFVEAAKTDRRRSLRALSQAWLAYLTHVQKKGDEGALVDLAVKAIEMLAQLGNAATDRAASASSGAEADAGQGLGSGEVPAAQAAVLYVLRVGVIEQMGETGQRLLLERLTALAASVLGDCTPVAAVTLEALGLLLEVLGEVAPEVTALLQDPLTWKLTGGCSLLRAQAAATMAALSVAEPASACRLLTQQLDGLEEASSQLASLVGPFGAQTPPLEPPQGRSGTGTPRGLGGTERDKLKPVMDSVHGRALGTAALLVASTRLALGVPSRLARRALESAEGLITRPGSQSAAGQGVQREAGYIILSALCVCGSPELLKPAELLDLWQPALGADSAAALDVRRFAAAPSPSWETEAAAEMWWRASALQALQAFALGPLATAPRPEAERMQETIAALLAPTLDIISSLPPLQEAARGKAVGPGPAFVAAAAQLQLRLVEAYLALPDAAAFATEHEALSKLCARAFRSATGTGTAQSVAASALQQVLNHQDDVLGPWAPGRDPLEDALAAFAGAPGGPVHHPWEAGLPYSAGYLGAEAAGAAVLKRSHQPLPQPRSLSAALLEAQLTLLGSLLAVVSQPNQLQILDVLNAASNEGMGGKGRRERPDPVRRHTAVTCVCAAALAGLDTLARKFRGEVGSRDEVAARASGLADSVLSVAADAGDAALQRSAAEMFAFASCIGSTGFAAALVRNLVSATAETSSAPRRAALALAIGCIIRSKGGIALQSTLTPVADTFLAVAAVCTGPVQLWLLHGLWLTANAAGPAFLPHVKATLAHAVQVLMAEDNAAVAGLQPAVGRLANALVAVLGPELTLGSAAYCRCRAIIREMQAMAGAVGRPEDAPAAALETVSYAQMLVLFAPQAVPAAAHLPLLLDTLPSRQPTLRRAAALTLRHLAERDAGALLPARMEGSLFRALDAETDGEIAEQLRATLRTLLRNGVPCEPSYWLEVCSQVALAAAERTAGLGDSMSGSGGAAGTSGFRGGLDEGLMDGGDEEEAEDGGSRVGGGGGGAPVRGPSLPPGDAVAAVGGARLGGAPRLRTRLFAAQCILDIPSSVGADARHFDTATSGGGDWLVTKLQALIDAGFKMASGAVEALRPLGVQLLQAVLGKFGAAEDPLLPGHLLLEQYQAQFVSALRSALAPGAAPSLAAAGASLAAAFLEAGMAAGDTVVLRRLIGLLVEPLAAWDSIPEEVYAEWVGVRARVSLLEAHAQCAAFTAARAGDSDVAIITGAQAPHARTLQRQWGALLQDWALLGSCSPEAAAAYTPAFLPEPAAAVLPRVADAIDKAAPASLLALSSLLAGACDAADLDDFKAAAQQLLDICHFTIAQSSARLAPPAHNVPSSNGGLPHSSAAAEPAQLLLTALTALQRLVAAESPLLGTVDLENLIVLINSTLQQVLAPLLTCNQTRGHQSPDAAAACFAAAVAILASVGRSAAASAGSSHLDERLAEAALCAISIAVTVSEAPSTLTKNVQIESGLQGAFQAAEGVCQRERHLAAALLSAAIRVLQISHQDAHINAARGFLERVAPVLGEPDRARNGGRIAAEPPLLAATLGSLADVAQECLSQAEVSNGDGGTAVKTSGRISAVVSLLMSMGAELESDQPSGNAAADRGANARSGLSDAAEHGADARAGSSEAPDDDFDDFEEAEEGSSSSATAVTTGAAPDAGAPAQDAATGELETPDAASRRDDAEEGASEKLARNGDEQPGGSGLGMEEAAAVREASDGRSAETAVVEAPAVTVPAVGSSSTNTDIASLGSSGRRASGDWGARERCLQVVEACCSCSSQPPVQAAALQAVRGALQRSQAANGGVPSAEAAAGHVRRAAWAWECASRALPAAAADVHALMRAGKAADLGTAEVQVVAETLKLLVASLPCAGAKLGGTMSVLLIMLVEVASPEGTPHAALRDLAVKLVTLVASGPSGAPFQAAVAALSPEAKQRLQAALKASSAAPPLAAAKAAKVAVNAPPAITLQNFALKS